MEKHELDEIIEKYIRANAQGNESHHGLDVVYVCQASGYGK